MKIKILEEQFSVCKVADYSCVDLERAYCFTGSTDEEHSLVCLTGQVPENTLEREDGWRAFRVEGVLDFSLIGILSDIAGVLAEEKIGIFVVSTYNTDYILVKEENFDRAVKALRMRGRWVFDSKYRV